MDAHDTTLLSQHLKELAQEHEEAKIIVAYEASTLGFGIYDECVAAGIECHILAPTKMPKSPRDRKRKHDKHDAQRIFEFLKGHVLAGNDPSASHKNLPN
jgi:transposase